MVRGYIFIILLFLYFECPSFTQEVNIKMNVPEHIQAGSDITVEIELNKGERGGLARFQQQLPKGITATAINLANADFSFEKNKIILIWLKLPDESRVKVVYSIHANKHLKGEFSIGGKFSFIEVENREEIELTKHTIKILPSLEVDEALIVDVNDFTEDEPLESTTESLAIGCYRQKPFLTQSGDGYIVNLLISRGKTEKLARLEEMIPVGFIAENILDASAIFSYKSGIAKFLWMTLPEDPLFVVTYKIIPEVGQKLRDGSIEGNYSYMDNGSSIRIPVIEKDINLTNSKDRDLSSIIEHIQKLESEKTKLVLPQKLIEPDPVNKTGIFFRIQIMAASKPIKGDSFFKSNNIQGQIYTEFQNGFYKYTTGSYKQYARAREHLLQIQRNSGITEAFICAYQEGKRIPVKRALELTNQK